MELHLKVSGYCLNCFVILFIEIKNKTHQYDDTPEGVSFVQMFLLFFPRTIIDLILEETNKRLGTPADLGEFLRFIGIILFIATQSSINRREYWSHRLVSIEYGAPYRFHEWMSGARFEKIMSSLTLTDEAPPAYKDKFWEVRKMISLWKENMASIFSCSWASCLDESMSIWLNKWTCPGWVFCPRKPHPFGNEYHTICCGLSGVLFDMEMVEGKDEPKELKAKQKEINKYGTTCGLLMRLCKTMYSTGKSLFLFYFILFYFFSINHLTNPLTTRR